MSRLTKTQRKSLLKQVSVTLAKYMHTVYELGATKIGIGREVSCREDMCFVGHIAGFCDLFARLYGEKSCGKFSCSLYANTREKLFGEEGEEIRNPLESLLHEFMESAEFETGFVAGTGDATALIKGMRGEERSLMGRNFLLAIKSL